MTRAGRDEIEWDEDDCRSIRRVNLVGLVMDTHTHRRMMPTKARESGTEQWIRRSKDDGLEVEMVDQRIVYDYTTSTMTMMRRSGRAERHRSPR